jgi:anti-sigma-K factor RskA
LRVSEESAFTARWRTFLADLDHEYMVPGVVPASGLNVKERSNVFTSRWATPQTQRYPVDHSRLTSWTLPIRIAGVHQEFQQA